MVSLITTWCMLGHKISKVPELHGLWQYKKKQKAKVASLEALERAVSNSREPGIVAPQVLPDMPLIMRSRPVSIEMASVQEDSTGTGQSVGGSARSAC